MGALKKPARGQLTLFADGAKPQAVLRAFRVPPCYLDSRARKRRDREERDRAVRENAAWWRAHPAD